MEEIVKLKVPTNTKNMLGRMKKLQVENIAETFFKFMAKQQAEIFVSIFRKGIAQRTLGLQRLKPVTIAQKKKKGYILPTTPLYGAGLQYVYKTYMNMLRIRQSGKKWVVKPSDAKHHESNLRLSDLFSIHEHGRTILGKNGKAFKIPPRPAYFIARMQFKQLEEIKEFPEEMKKAIVEYVKTGSPAKMNELKKKKAKHETKGHESANEGGADFDIDFNKLLGVGNYNLSDITNTDFIDYK